MTEYFLLFAMIILAIISIYYGTMFKRVLDCQYQKHQEEIKELGEQYRKDKRDLLDRLMAKDLSQLKQAQSIEGNTQQRTVSSKLDNEKRKSEEQRRLLGK